MSGTPALWLVRHAQPQVAPGVCYGRLDLPVEPAHQHATLQALRPVLPRAAVLRHSPLQRCAQLAAALAPSPHDRVADARLQELDFGTWEGQAWATLPAAAIDAWAQNLAQHAPGGGECLQAMLVRVQAALLASWRHDSACGQRDVVWVTHAGVIRCVHWLLQHGTALPQSAQWRLPAPDFGHWTVLPWQPHQAALQALG